MSPKSGLNQILLGGMMIATSVFIRHTNREMGKDLPTVLGMNSRMYRMILFLLGLILVLHALFVQFQTGKLKGDMKTLLAVLGSLGIFLGVYLTKSFQPNPASNFEMALKEYGGFIFTFGWLAVAYSVSLSSQGETHLLSLMTLVGILSSMVYIMSNGNGMTNSSMVLFALAWVALATGMYF